KAREIARDEAMKVMNQTPAPEKFGFGVAWEKEWSYSQGTKVGNVIYVAGQLAHGQKVDDKGMPEFMMGNFEQQYKATLENIKAVLAHYGATMDDVVFLQNFVAPVSRDKTMKAGAYNDAAAKLVREYFPKGLHAMTFVDVVALYGGKQLVESNAIAVITSKPAEAPAAEAAPAQAPAEEKK
ncbi:MAG: RidA family protein, partial [Candidatus Latescibacterota bacterium]